MAGQKPETRFYTAIHRLLPKTIYHEKMYNPLRGGTPDVWYSGNLDDLWVEYKWLPQVPRLVDIHVSKLLSELQLRWLDLRHKEGRNVVVILGSPEGAWVFEPPSWREPLAPDLLRHKGLSKQGVADYIRRRVLIE